MTDQALKQRRNIVDGLGRLVRVDEPNLSNSLGGITSPAQATSYTYDAFSNLTQVTQDVQTRSFTYSSLSRLTSGVNPESGTTSYTYDNNGNLMTKTDGRGVVKGDHLGGVGSHLCILYFVFAVHPGQFFSAATAGALSNKTGAIDSKLAGSRP